MSNQNWKNRPEVVACPPPEVVTEKHIDNALAVLAELHHYIFPPEPAPGNSIPKEAQRLDGEALIAATSTFIKTCARLDSLIADESRWTLATYKELYAALNANYQQQFQFLRAQTLAANNLSRPSFLYKPELVQTEDGEFVCYFGAVTTPGRGLLGKGKTPAEAFADFDAAFYRAEQHHLENTDPEPKPKRKKK